MNGNLILKIIRCSIVAALFVCILTIQGISSLREAQQIIFMLVSIALFSLILRNIWISLFLCWTVFLYAFFKFSTGNIYLSNIFFGCILYLVTKIGFKKENINFFINGFLWFVFVNIVYMVLQLCSLDFIYGSLSYTYNVEMTKQIKSNILPTGFMGHLSIMGTLLALAIPILVSRKTVCSKIAGIGLFIPLYICKTSLPFLIGIVGFLFVSWFQIPKKLWIIGTVILIISGLIYLKNVDKLGLERLPQWKRVLSDCMAHPITGWGLDSFRNFNAYKDFRYMQTNLKFSDSRFITYWDNPHNLYISLFFEFGFIGLFLLAGFLRQNVLRFQKVIKDSNIIGLAGFILVFLGVSMGHFPIFLARCAIFIIPMFALFEIAAANTNG